MHWLRRLQGLTALPSGRVRLRACDELGEGSHAVGQVRVVNRGRIVVGRDVRISGDPVASHLLADDGGLIEIEDRVSIGHGTGISAKKQIRIGQGTRIGAFVLAMDTDYHVAGDAAADADVVPITRRRTGPLRPSGGGWKRLRRRAGAGGRRDHVQAAQ